MVRNPSPASGCTKDEPLLVRIPSAAELLSVSVSRAYELARRGELPGLVVLGGTLRVSLRLLEEWIEAHGAGTPARGATGAGEDRP